MSDKSEIPKPAPREMISMMEGPPLISAVNLQKTYRRNADKVRVLCGLDLEVQEGEFLSVIGASGSGKSTMLHLLGTLD
jgi:ABC-type lipoprotein export system ATPase subunit